MIELRDLKSFLKNPSPEKRLEIGPTFSFFRLVWTTFLYVLVISLVVGLIITTPLSYLNLLPSLKDMSDSFNTILITVLIVPIVEEIVFRLPLIITKRNMSISLCFLIFLIFRKTNFYLAIIATFLLATIFAYIFKKNLKIIKSLDSLVSKNYSVYFYAVALAFGVLHIGNYNLDFSHFYIFPFLILVYFFIGIFLGYVRVRYRNGIYVCIISHILMNSLYCIF